MHYGRAPRIDHRMQSHADEAKRVIPHQGERQAALADVGVVLRQVECDFARLYCIHNNSLAQWHLRTLVPPKANAPGRVVVDRVIE